VAENTPESWPIVTLSDKDARLRPEYRQRVANNLAEIVFYFDNYLGTGRAFVPF
jgi:hypothetical protein